MRWRETIPLIPFVGLTALLALATDVNAQSISSDVGNTTIKGSCNITNLFASSASISCVNVPQELVDHINDLVSELKNLSAQSRLSADDTARVLRGMSNLLSSQLDNAKDPELSISTRPFIGELLHAKMAIINTGGYIKNVNTMSMNWIKLEFNENPTCPKKYFGSYHIPLGPDSHSWEVDQANQYRPATFAWGFMYINALEIRRYIAAKLDIPAHCIFTNLEDVYVGIGYENYVGLRKERWWRVEHLIFQKWNHTLNDYVEFTNIEDKFPHEIANMKQRRAVWITEWGEGVLSNNPEISSLDIANHFRKNKE